MNLKLGGLSLLGAHAALGKVGKSDTWLLDSGANASSCYSRNVFDTFSDYQDMMMTMSGESVNIQGKGMAKVGDNISVVGAMYSLDSALNLLSVSQLTQNGNDVLFQNGRTYVYVNGEPVLCAEEHQGLFLVMPNSMDDQERITYAPKIVECHYEAESFPKLNEVCVGVASMTGEPFDFKSLHVTLGHAFEAYVRAFAKSQGSVITGSFPTDCSVCVRAKSSSKPHTGQVYFGASAPFDIIHSDVAQIHTISREGFKYFMTFMDKYSRLTFYACMQKKNEVCKRFENLCDLVKTQFDVSVKHLI